MKLISRIIIWKSSDFLWRASFLTHSWRASVRHVCPTLVLLTSRSVFTPKQLFGPRRPTAKSQPIWLNFAHTYRSTEYTCGPT